MLFEGSDVLGEEVIFGWVKEVYIGLFVLVLFMGDIL